jgi:hypothetical protein
MKKNVNFLFLFVVVCSLSSCATILTGTKDTIVINSIPEGAKVYKDGLVLCETPCRTSVKRSVSDTDIELKLDGYKPSFFTLSKEFNIVSVVNLTNPFGWGVDALSGAIMKYDRKSYEIELEPKK